MKEFKKINKAGEVVFTEYVTKDGMIFYNKEDCEEYEASELYEVSCKLNAINLPLGGNASTVFGAYDDGIDVEIFDIQNETDIANLYKYIILLVASDTNENPIDSGGFRNITVGHEVVVFVDRGFGECWTHGDGSINAFFAYMGNCVKKHIKEAASYKNKLERWFTDECQDKP